MKLVIIGGFPRSGTRQFTDIMNFHEDFTIQGEIHSNVLEAIARLFKAADKSHSGKRTERAFFSRRPTASLEVYRLVSKSNSEPLKYNYSGKCLGFKQPLIESRHEILKIIFERDYKNCHFFVCLRNLYDNFLSLNSAFGWTIEKYIHSLKVSISALQVMDKDDFFILQPLCLDSYISSVNKESWLRESIFHPLDISLSNEWLADCLKSTTNRNKTPENQRKHELDEFTRSTLLGDRELMEAVDWLETRFSANLLGKLH
jgi:hypothetical protein